MKRLTLLSLVAGLAAVLGLAPQVDAQPQPMPTPADIRFEKVKAKAAGKTYTVKRNHVFDATAKAEHERHEFNLNLGLQAEKTDHTFAHALKRFAGCKPPADLKERQAASHKLHGHHLKSLPRATQAQYDCVANGIVNPIKNQAQCGSCWDFSGTCAVESANILAKNGAVGQYVLSEQYTLDCYQNGGCDGDWPETVLARAKANGLPLTSDYGPYQGQSGHCKTVTSYPGRVADYGYIATDSTVASYADIKAAILKYGVVTICVAVDDSWSAYSDGVFQDTGYTQVNHAIDCVGWDDTKGHAGALKVRNHWGTQWGEQGYMWTEPGANQIGYGAMWCSATSPNPSPTPPTPGPTPPAPVPPAPTLPTYSVTVTGQIPSGGLFGGSKTVTLTGTASPAATKVRGPLTVAQKEARLKDCNTARAVKEGLGLSFSTIIDLMNLFTLLREDGNGELLADLTALEAAVAARSGIVTAAEKLLSDAIAVSTDPALIAALGKVLADLGVAIP